MRPNREAKAQGFNGVLFLDSVHNKNVEEAGAANFFALMNDDTLVTPRLGAILPGITRESILKIASDLFGFKVEERELGIDEVCENAKECFLSGTGATITSISEISWKDHGYNVNKNDFQLAHRLYDRLLGIQLQREEDPYAWVMEVK